MARKSGGYNEGINVLAEIIEDASNFKVVPRARDPKSFPTLPGTPVRTHKRGKKPRKKKDK